MCNPYAVLRPTIDHFALLVFNTSNDNSLDVLPTRKNLDTTVSELPTHAVMNVPLIFHKINKMLSTPIKFDAEIIL